MMKKLAILFLLLAFFVGGASAQELRFAVSFPAERSREPLDGRLLLLISKDPSNEPRFQILTGPKTQVAFGIDVEGLAPGKDAILDASALGYPVDSLRHIPKGR